jgi:hypothetical protein
MPRRAAVSGAQPRAAFARASRWALLATCGIALVASAAWGVLALAWFDDAASGVRVALASAFGLASLATLVAFLSPRWRWRAFAVQAVLFGILLWRWLALEPSNDRDWLPENARLAHVSIAGDRITVHDIRNFDYRTETDFTPAWYDRTFDLRQLDSADLVAVYWMGPAIAHVFVTFGFGDDHLAISIEARKRRGQGYSTLAGFFRQYELIYVVADERDVIRLRTNYRHDPPEEVRVFRLSGTRDELRRFFLDYVDKIDSLATRPEFYNSLTTNCTTNIWLHSRVNPGHVPWSWKILASGFVPEYLYESGRLDTSLPFAELQRRSVVNARAQAADQAADFSRRIRLPADPPR